MGIVSKYLLVLVVGSWMYWGCAPKPIVRPPHAANSNVLVQKTDGSKDRNVKDESSIVQRSGQKQRVKLPDAMANVLGRLTTPKATYILLGANHEGTLAPTRLESVMDASGNLLVAAVAGTGAFSQSVSAPEYELVLRFAGSTPTANPSKIRWQARRISEPESLASGYEQELTLAAIEAAPIQRDLEARFGEAMAAWFDEYGKGEPFTTFAAARLMQKLVKGVPEQNPRRWRWQNNRAQLLDLMDFYTGRSTIRDSLQIERGLQLPRKPSPQNIDPSTIRSEAVQERNYEQLVAKDSRQGAPVISPLSTVVPADALVVEFASLKDVIQLPRLLDQKLGQILRVAEGTGGPNHLIERYRNQLAIELDGFAETVGQFAVKSVAVVLGDPYLREGTDLSMIFRAENQALLASVLGNHLARAKARHPDLTGTQERIFGELVTVNATTDSRTRRYEYANGEYRILSNSRTAIGRLIQVKQGKLARLSEDKGYLGARTLAPFSPERERAFVFFGDAFIANVISARSRILEARRMRAQSELEAVDHGALLFGWLEGRRPSNLAELLESGWLSKSDLVHSDGSPISWSQSAGAHSHWGYSKSLTPIVDLPFDKVSSDEVAAYKSFRTRYDNDMNGILDPTSLYIERTADDPAIHTELRVFPIMPRGSFQSDFREITRMVGDGRVEPGAQVRGLTVTLGVGEGSPLRNLTDESIHSFLGKGDLSVSFVGDWVRAGLDEGSAIWDIAASEHMISGLQTDDTSQNTRINFDSLIPKLPVWIAVNIKSRLLLAAALTALRAKVEETANGLVKWQKDAPYRDIPITRVRAKENDSADALQVSIYYAIAKNVLLISLRRDILNLRIDDVLEGRTPKSGRLPGTPSQFALDFAPLLGGWLRRAAHASLDTTAVEAHERACIGFEVLARGVGAIPTDPAAKRELALRLLGYDPESPQGGPFTWHDGVCEHAVYGNPVEPRAPDANDASLPLHALVSDIGSLRFALGLVPRGGSLELWAKFQLEKGPSSARSGSDSN